MPIDEQKNNRSDACTALGEQLSAYLDSELNEEETEAVEAHLLVCDDCAALCRALRALRVEIAGAQLDPPPELHEKIMVRIRHESRMRRLRRIAAAASAGVAAMFCFVIIGGAMRTADHANEKMDRAMYMANTPEAENALALNGNAARCMDAMTGGVLDMSLEADITIVGTGLSEGEGEDGNSNDALLPEEDKLAWKTTTAPETRTPETTTVVPIPPTAEPVPTLPCGVVAAILPEEMRSLSLLGSLGSLTGMSTEKPVYSNSTGVAVEQNSLETLSNAMACSDMQLAEVQLGTLCVVELADGFTTCPYVYDMTTGSRLDLCDFLGSNDALTALADASGLPLTADAFYRPLAEGIYFPELATSIAWDADPTLTACIARYAMTEEPLCTVEGASIQR